jgi:superfamily II DNA or RNA helicase
VESNKTGFRKGFHLWDFQVDLAKRILSALFDSRDTNVFLSLPQGTGKTVIVLYALSELINNGHSNRVLILLPRRTLVDQWVERAQEMFYGLGIMKNPTLSKENIMKIRGWLRHSGAAGMAMTVHSFKNYFKKGYFTEEDFDTVIVDEAADLVISKDFIEGFRMSRYLKGLQKWNRPKMLVLPYHVSEKKIRALVRKFGKESVLIRETIKDPSLKPLQYTVYDPILIDDPPINVFTRTLNKYYRKTKTNVHRILNKYGIEGYRENLETLLNPLTMKRLKKRYHIDEETEKQIQTLISKYILMGHLMRWFLYSNREELGRSILASQMLVEEWLSYDDKKLATLIEVVKSYLDKGMKVYIFSRYVATAHLIASHLKEKLRLKRRDVVAITGADTDQYLLLDSYKKVGRVLISTPVFDKGTDIPEADAMIVYTPPFSVEKLFQVTGRIRGGEIVFLAYEGYEGDLTEAIVDSLRKAFAEARGEDLGISSHL